MSLELIPIEIIEEFGLDLVDVISFQRVCKSMYLLIKERAPRIFSQVTFTKEMESWAGALMNVKLEDTENLSLFTRVHALDLSRTSVKDVSRLGKVHS